jgi:hypothetical protein
LAAAAQAALDRLRSGTDRLDGTDLSLWFVQGALGSMSNDPRAGGGDGSEERFAYAVYIAETLASTCEGVRVEIVGDGRYVAEVSAAREQGPRQFVLTWVQKCVEDPNADNIVFKYAGALRDFGQHDRAERLYEQLREYAASGHRF